MSGPNFKGIFTVVTNMFKSKDLGEITVEDGNASLSDEQRNELVGVFGEEMAEKFIEAYNKDLSSESTEEARTSATEEVLNSIRQHNVQELQAKEDEINRLMNENVNLKADKEVLQTSVLEMSNETVVDKPEMVIGGKGNEDGAYAFNSADVKGDVLATKTDRKFYHNQMAFEFLNGDNSKAILAEQSGFSFEPGANQGTIDVADLNSEFGTYLSDNKRRLEIIRILTQKTESQKYMTTKMVIEEYRAAKAQIESVVQQFYPEWTPLSKTTFTPITVKNRRHKINVPIVPDDITGGWLTYLYEESVTPDKMPIVRYIVDVLLRPKIEEDIELLLIANGEFEELPDNITEGQAGQATGKSMDGYITQLNQHKASGTSNMNFFTPSVEVTEESIVDVLEEYADWIENLSPLYAKKGMKIFIDPVLWKKDQRKYRDLFPTTKNEDKGRKGPDFSKLEFVPLEAMRGSGTFFSTPRVNFIRLIHKNQAGAATRLFLQVHNYTVKVFGEFWLGVGFALEELVFAYVPEVAASGSGV